MSTRHALLLQKSAMHRLSVLLFPLILPALAQGQTIADLKMDWSDVNNPNGPWAYRQGTTLLPHFANWSPGAPVPQPAWATGVSPSPFLPAIFQTTSNDAPAVLDWQVGDIICHTTDDTNGSGFGVANITWTSTVTGSVSFSGGVWEARDIGRSTHWEMFKNNVLLTGGDISSGDPYSRANPFDFSLGSGGTTALQNLGVSSGDVFELRMTRTSAAGDFAGMNWTISAVPEPTTWALIGLSTLGTGFVWYLQRVRQRRADNQLISDVA